MSTAAQDREAIYARLVTARERLLGVRFYVRREGEGWYVGTRPDSFGIERRAGAKRDLTVDEWRAVDRRLESAAVEIAQARRVAQERIALEAEAS